ncbi:uncharacterized protein PHACADRAFT_127014 [Phanerochaete carnosa HHB-10118-sp]|uniref:YCII-related domain-containing protein n=1 Tax=Phanerochaete carnosa (strain HHB-10118-sp) TaxID=650164 RepID=K5WRA8_PHACS|nr:uncharacterized protein PHACADRAFT_127014 [Phanerochaete carnosa HHB-10118-sp]EKM52902.1 hypothetical protein PHACADRAFT_127014 [Phanerochaete carnosa HHB-10118-sp]
MAEEKTLYTFFVYTPDYTDPDAPNRRAAVRPKHLENAKRIRAQGVIRLGGALISPETYQSAERKMIGSMGVYQAENIEAVQKVIEEDIYYTGNVWDKEKIIILPWVPAFPLPPVSPE